MSVTNDTHTPARRALEPIDRISEMLFSLIMVLTFTGSISVAEAGRDDVRLMLVGALGCNLAWGIIDAVFYLMGSLAERGRALEAVRAVRAAADPVQARGHLADALPQTVAAVVEAAELDAMCRRLKQLPEPPAYARLQRHDWTGAAAVFLLVFLVTFPVVIPFIIMRNVAPALAVSNAIAIALMFVAGFAFGRLTGRSPFRVGVFMVLLGAVLVAITKALGG
jgi:hypothetical protein